jgi:hypothetical protein
MEDPTVYYKASDIDDANDTKYYGFLAANGDWYIMREDSLAKTFRFVRNRGGYPDAWTGRAGLSYDYFDVVF